MGHTCVMYGQSTDTRYVKQTAVTVLPFQLLLDASALLMMPFPLL